MNQSTDPNSPLPEATVRSWESLAAAAATLPTQDAAWTLASLAAFEGSENVLTRGDGEHLEALAPLVRNRGRLEMPGCAYTGEPIDLLTTSAAATEALAEEVAATGLPLLLERLPARSGTLEALRSAYGRNAVVRIREMVGHPVLELDERWSEPGGGLSSSRRSALRRGRRKAERYGTLEVELLRPRPDQLEPLLEEAFEVEARSWKAQTGTAVAFVPRMTAFFNAYARELSTRGQFQLDFLRIDGRAVAMQYGAVWKGRHWLFKIGYDAHFAGVSPGQILLAESVAGATRAGLSHYELFGSQADWTDAWTQEVEPCLHALFVPRTARGAIGAAAVRGRDVGRRLEVTVRRVKRKAAETIEQTYVTGPELSDALAELRRCEAASYETTVGFWPWGSVPPEEIAAQARASAESLPAGSEISFKPTDTMMGDAELDSLLATATSRGLTLHLDAIGIDSATPAQETAKRLSAAAPGQVGCTLPGRWRRSAEDAAALAGSGLRLRVVKGEFEDPEGSEVDPADGFRAVVSALAGGNCHVEVATHDPVLAELTLSQLVDTGTSCELQILFATDGDAAVRAARKLGVPVRVYLPYGHGRLPYNRAALRARPALLKTVARDLLPVASHRPPGA